MFIPIQSSLPLLYLLFSFNAIAMGDPRVVLFVDYNSYITHPDERHHWQVLACNSSNCQLSSLPGLEDRSISNREYRFRLSNQNDGSIGIFQANGTRINFRYDEQLPECPSSPALALVNATNELYSPSAEPSWLNFLLSYPIFKEHAQRSKFVIAFTQLSHGTATSQSPSDFLSHGPVYIPPCKLQCPGNVCRFCSSGTGSISTVSESSCSPQFFVMILERPSGRKDNCSGIE